MNVLLTPQTYLCKRRRYTPSTCPAETGSFYNSPKYARALHQFNKENPMSRANVLQDNPPLAVGQPVFLAPKDFLESHYPSLISNAPTSPVAQSQVPISINAPLAGTVGGQIASLPSIGRPATAVQPPIRPGPIGFLPKVKCLQKSPRTQLGDLRRWTEIYPAQQQSTSRSADSWRNRYCPAGLRAPMNQIRPPQYNGQHGQDLAPAAARRCRH